METNTQFKLVDFTKKLREAEFNTKAFYLKSIYNNWARDLHCNGLTLGYDKLKLIAEYGLIEYYFYIIESI